MFTFWLGCAEPPAAPIDERVPALRPVVGGNLLTRADGGFVAADTERDRLWFGRATDKLELDRAVDLEVGSWPVRLAEAPDGSVWVSLRGTGQVARVTETVETFGSGSQPETFDVCAGPHGLWADEDGIAVACTDGDLVWLDLDGQEVDRVTVAPDLRDVVRVDGEWWTSTFRSAELYVLRGETREVRRPPEVTDRRAEVAWRLRFDPVHGGAVMSHQRARSNLVDLTVLGTPAYGTDFCDSAVEPAITRFFPDGTAESTGPMRKSVLPVDVLVGGFRRRGRDVGRWGGMDRRHNLRHNRRLYYRSWIPMVVTCPRRGRPDHRGGSGGRRALVCSAGPVWAPPGG